MAGLKADRMDHILMREISNILQFELKNPKLGFVTVTDVEVTGDLRQATIYVSLFGSDEEKKASLQALKHAAGHVRSELGKVLRLRYTPEIAFANDTSLGLR